MVTLAVNKPPAIYFRTTEAQRLALENLLVAMRAQNPHRKISQWELLRELVDIGIREKTRRRKGE